MFFFADEGVSLIDLRKPENKDYKEWYERQNSIWQDRPEQFYLSEGVFILEENYRLYYLNEETGEKRLALEGDARESIMMLDGAYIDVVAFHRSLIIQNFTPETAAF